MMTILDLITQRIYERESDGKHQKIFPQFFFRFVCCEFFPILSSVKTINCIGSNQTNLLITAYFSFGEIFMKYYYRNEIKELRH